MQGSKKIPIIDLNQHITCKICNGYFVDATTIIECLHTFCRSCIVKYLESNKYCPVCDVQVHKTKPLLNIRPDKTVQDIVYKLVPRLFQNEMLRRREFYESHPEAKPSSLEQCGEASYQHLLTPEETICLTLSYHGCNNTPRYLRCPAAVSVGHLKKLIRAKYDLTDNHRVEILYNQDGLNSSLTLMDVAYIYLWKRKGPIELTYRIYECKKPQPDQTPAQAQVPVNNNNNNWKEVQLRISENGEMSITGIRDSLPSPSLLEIVNSDQKYKNEVVTVVETKPSAPKKELPGLKYIGKNPQPATTSNSVSTAPPVTKKPRCEDAPLRTPDRTLPEKTRVELELSTTSFLTSCATLSSGTTTTVFSTINSSKCSTKTDDTPPKLEVKPPDSPSVKPEEKPQPPPNNSLDKGVKRKNEGASETEPVNKQPKPTILNHSIGLLNLSNNHPLKKHSKLNRNGENVREASQAPEAQPQTTNAVEVFSKPSVVTKTFAAPLSSPGTPIMTSKPSIIPAKSTAAFAGAKPPCYMPKTSYGPVINVPKPTTSTLRSQSGPKPEAKPLLTAKAEAKAPQQLQAPPAAPNNKLGGIKSKPSTPIGYKTLRDPPKSWNSQISKANLSKPQPDPKYTDQKNVRPAKFFKMRNNMPRYLGNPASGVKPMYQVHVSPEKDKHHEPGGRMEKCEIRKHSIVKVDPKTLKPISEKAPETTSLSNHGPTGHNPTNHTAQAYAAPPAVNAGSDLKINTSSVSIFNPLKLQSSPKNERKSPKSPHSPKMRAQAAASPTGGGGVKRDKVNLNFTPPNPFIPNLASPTMSPNQFLYPAGPPGFPTYDPRMMAAYHSLWYGQRMGFPGAPIPGLSLDLNQRKSFEMMPSPTSPKMGGMTQQGHGPQISNKLASTTSSSIPRSHGPHPPTNKGSSQPKKPSKEPKSEKSLETTVEKLTQNRHKEISGKNDVAAVVRNAEKVDSREGGKEKRQEAGKGEEKPPQSARDQADGKQTPAAPPKAVVDVAGEPPSSVGEPPVKNAPPIDSSSSSPDKSRLESNCKASVVENDAGTAPGAAAKKPPRPGGDEGETTGSNGVKVNDSSDSKPSEDVAKGGDSK